MKLVDSNETSYVQKNDELLDAIETNVVRPEKTMKLEDSNETNVIHPEKRRIL